MKCKRKGEKEQDSNMQTYKNKNNSGLSVRVLYSDQQRIDSIKYEKHSEI